MIMHEKGGERKRCSGVHVRASRICVCVCGIYVRVCVSMCERRREMRRGCACACVWDICLCVCSLSEGVSEAYDCMRCMCVHSGKIYVYAHKYVPKCV